MWRRSMRFLITGRFVPEVLTEMLSLDDGDAATVSRSLCIGESGKQCRQCAMRPLTAHVENGDRSRTSRLFARLSAFRSRLCCRLLFGWWGGRKVARLACGPALDLKPQLAQVFLHIELFTP